MPVPKILKYKPVSDKKTIKSNIIIRQLFGMGYDVDDARSAIKIIKDDNLDKSQFDFPYESFEETKAHVLAGEFDYDDKPFSSSKEEIEALDKAVKEGKLWITY